MLGGYLRRMRGDRTQEEIADAAGIDGANIDAVATALGVSSQEILDLAEEPGAVAELAVQLAALEQRVAALEG